MKVLYASDYYPFYGGKVVYEIAKRLSREGLITKILSSDVMGNPEISQSFGEDLPPVTRLRARRIDIRDTSYLLYDLRDWGFIEKQLDVDVIHLHFLYGFLSLYIGIMKRIKRIEVPIVATSHGLTRGYSSSVVQGAAILLNELSKKIIVANASAVTTVSRLEYDFLKHYVPTEKLSFIPNGIDPDIFEPDVSKRHKLRKKIGFDENDFVVLYFAHLRSTKGVSTFLEAMSKVIERTCNIKFVVAGSGPLSYLVKTAEKKFDSRVHSLSGYVSDKEVPFLYNASDVYVLPSYVEGMPLSVMEAMACGKPVIVTCVGDMPVLVKNGVNGIVIPPGKADQLAESIIHLDENPELRNLMSKANVRKMKQYDWDKIAKQYHSLYENLLLTHECMHAR